MVKSQFTFHILPAQAHPRLRNRNHRALRDSGINEDVVRLFYGEREGVDGFLFHGGWLCFDREPTSGGFLSLVAKVIGTLNSEACFRPAAMIRSASITLERNGWQRTSCLQQKWRQDGRQVAGIAENPPSGLGTARIVASQP